MSVDLILGPRLGFLRGTFLNNGSKPDNSFSVDDIDKIRDEIVSQNATLESFGQTLYLF